MTTAATAIAEQEMTLARSQGRRALAEDSSKRVLAAFGFSVPRSRLIRGGDPLASALSDLRPPYVVKIVSPDALHKTEMGGVRIGLADGAAVEAAIGEMRARLASARVRIDGWMVEEQAPKGVEVVIGGVVNDRFGPVVMFGLGGILVELMADISFRICPIAERDAHQMISELRGAPLLRGWRGSSVASQESMVSALMRVGGPDGLMLSLGDVLELDINPLIVSDSGAVAVDARIVLKDADGHAA